MEDKNISPLCKEIIENLKSHFENTKNIISSKEEEIKSLKKDLELSESRRQTAEDMVTQIKEEVTEEIKKAYNSGYNAALTNPNPDGGTSLSEESDKKLVLNNQN